MLALFVAPVCLKPGATAAFPDQLHDLCRVVRQEHLHRAEPLDDVRKERAGGGIRLVPRHVSPQIPAPPLLGQLEVLEIEVEKAFFDVPVHAVRPTTTLEFSPPKPNELDRAMSMRASRASFGTKSRSSSGSGCSWLMV